MRILLLVVCLVYGYLFAVLFGGESFNQVYLWSSFILFVINDSVMYGALNNIIQNDEDEE